MAFSPNKYMWNGNSKKMYEYIVSEVPFFAQIRLKNMIGKWLDNKEIIVITEDIIFRAVEDLAPTAFKKKLKDKLHSIKIK